MNLKQNKYKFSLLVISILFIFASCIVIKEKDEIVKKEVESDYKPAMKSKMKMSDQLIRTEIGDVVVSTPNGWFFVEPDSRVSSDVFAIVVNQDYTLSAVFSHVKKTAELNAIVEQEGVIGLARMCFNKHSTRNSNGITLIDNYQDYELNKQRFGIYSFTKNKDNSFGQSAVFISGRNEYYEISLLSMNFVLNNLPLRTEFDDIFYSILTTLKY